MARSPNGEAPSANRPTVDCELLFGPLPESLAKGAQAVATFMPTAAGLRQEQLNGPQIPANLAAFIYNAIQRGIATEMQQALGFLTSPELRSITHSFSCQGT